MNRIIRYIRHLLHEIIPVLTPKRFRKNILSCQQVTKLLENEASLEWKVKWKLKMHLLICQCCTDYKTQMTFISEEAKKLHHLELTQAQKIQLQKIQGQVLKSRQQ